MKKSKTNGTKPKAIAEFESDKSLLTLSEIYLRKAKGEIAELNISLTEKRKITGHIIAAWVKLMELKRGVEDKIDDILLRFDDSQFGEDDVRRDCRELYAMVESYKDKYGDGSDFIEDNIQKAWDEFIGKIGVSYLKGLCIRKGARRYDNCVIFIAHNREERDDFASIAMEARDFFKKRFGDKFYTTYTQCEYMKHECRSAYISYC